MNKLDEMREKINSLNIPFDMKKSYLKFYEQGYDDALVEKNEGDKNAN